MADPAPWNERYAGAGYFYGTEPNDFLREHYTAIPAAGSILCLGEGEGRNAVFLAGKGYRVTALDLSAVGLAKAERLAATRGVHVDTVQANLETYRIEPDGWDGIVAIWCHLPQALRPAVHRQIVAGLRPQGAFLLESYTPAQLRFGTGGPKTVDLLPTLQELRRDLDGLTLIHAAELERNVREGGGHTGLSAVVQVVARRPS